MSTENPSVVFREVRMTSQGADLANAFQHPIFVAVVNKTNTRVATVSYDHFSKRFVTSLWDTMSGVPLWQITKVSDYEPIKVKPAFSEDGNLLVAYMGNAQVDVVDARSGTTFDTYSHNKYSISNSLNVQSIAIGRNKDNVAMCQKHGNSIEAKLRTSTESPILFVDVGNEMWLWPMLQVDGVCSLSGKSRTMERRTRWGA